MMIRSLLEGVTYGMRDALEIMKEMKIPIGQIRASGGGARSPFWRQMQADIYQKTVVTTNAAEGPAYGAALLAGVGIGEWDSVEETAACIKEKSKLNPRPREAGRYERGYGVYRKLYWDLKERFGEMAGLGG